MSLFPAIWEKHANPHQVVSRVGMPDTSTLRVWKVEGQILDLINSRATKAQQAAEELETLAKGLNVSLAYLSGYQSFAFWVEGIDGDGEIKCPEGFEFHGRSDGIRYIESQDPSVKATLKLLNDQMTGWLGIRSGIEKLAMNLRGDLENRETWQDLKFWDRLESTRKSLKLVLFGNDYYITSAPDGLDMPECTEISYSEYLRMLSQHVSAPSEPSPR